MFVVRQEGSALPALVMAVAAAVIALAGCSGSGTLQPGAETAGHPTGLSSPLAQVEPRPVTVDGKPFNPAHLVGKPVVLWFWAPWCTICRGEAPTVAKIATEFSGRVQFIGVAGQGTVPAMRDFVRQTGAGSLTQLADVNGSIWRDYGVSVQPAFAFITPDGTTDLRVGSLDEQTLRDRVSEVAIGATSSSVTITPGQTCSRAPDGRLTCGSAGPPHTATPSHPTTPSPSTTP